LNKQYSLLATRLGNLVGRISSPKIQKRFLAAAEATTLSEPALNAPERALWDMLMNLQRGLETRLDKLEITAAMQDVMEIILEVRPPSLENHRTHPPVQANRIFTLLQPWTPSTPLGDLVKAMVLAHDSLRLAGIALQPVMPGKMEDLLGRLGVEVGERGWDELRSVGEVKGVVARVEKMKEGAKVKRGVLFPPLVEALSTT
jgi:methionyl-tRNA synthetase